MQSHAHEHERRMGRTEELPCEDHVCLPETVRKHGIRCEEVRDDRGDGTLLDVVEHLRDEEQRVIAGVGRDERADDHDDVDDDDRDERGDVQQTRQSPRQISPQDRSNGDRRVERPISVFSALAFFVFPSLISLSARKAGTCWPGPRR
jgi:hypothetical protein